MTRTIPACARHGVPPVGINHAMVCAWRACRVCVVCVRAFMAASLSGLIKFRSRESVVSVVHEFELGVAPGTAFSLELGVAVFQIVCQARTVYVHVLASLVAGAGMAKSLAGATIAEGDLACEWS